MIAKDSIEDLIKAIRLAGEDGLESVEVSMDDLLIMAEHIEDLQADCNFYEERCLTLQEKNKMLNISLARCELETLNKAVRLDYYV